MKYLLFILLIACEPLPEEVPKPECVAAETRTVRVCVNSIWVTDPWLHIPMSKCTQTEPTLQTCVSGRWPQ